MTRWLLAIGAIALVAACDARGGDPRPSASAAAPSASESASPFVAASLKTTKLARTTTPKDRRLADEKACDGGDLAGCRRAADRYRGYGHIAACGVDRERSKPSRAVVATDADADAERFDHWIRKACDLGDDEACVQGRNNVESHGIVRSTVDGCARSALKDCPLYLWATGLHPEKVAQMTKWRAAFLGHGDYEKYMVELYRREKKTGGDAVPAEMAALAEKICATTLECDDVFMMLDKNGYGDAALAPIKKDAGEALVKACLGGDCVCGEAARYLDPGDPRVVDLAKMGCDDGEPDACFLLGTTLEKSDLDAALALYDVACPSRLARDDREEVYSKRACTRLAELNEEGRGMEKSSPRGYYYAYHACTDPGFERDHTGCALRASYVMREFYSHEDQLLPPTRRAMHDLYGMDADPVNRGECDRPSAAAACAPLMKTIPRRAKDGY